MVEDEDLIDFVVGGVHGLKAGPLLVNQAYLLADSYRVLFHDVEVVGL